MTNTDNNIPKEIWADENHCVMSEIAGSIKGMKKYIPHDVHTTEIERRDRAIEVLMGAIKNIDSARCKKRLGVPELILSAMDYAAQANKKAQAILNGEASEPNR